MTRRYRIYRSEKARNWLCVCAAKNEEHALVIARRMFALERTAWAVLEPQMEGV